jgi:hypothetical protein
MTMQRPVAGHCIHANLLVLPFSLESLSNDPIRGAGERGTRLDSAEASLNRRFNVHLQGGLPAGFSALQLVLSPDCNLPLTPTT